MSYLDDKAEIIDDDSRRRESTGFAMATLTQLCNRHGCRGGMYWMIEKKAPEEIKVYDIDGNEEIWTLNGPQMGTPYKNKQYKRTALNRVSKPG